MNGINKVPEKLRRKCGLAIALAALLVPSFAAAVLAPIVWGPGNTASLVPPTFSLSGKTLSSPTISSPTISSPTVSGATFSGTTTFPGSTTVSSAGAIVSGSDVTVKSSLGSGFARTYANATSFTLTTTTSTTFTARASNTAGYLMISDQATGRTALFAIDYGSTRLVDGDNTFWSTTDGTGSRVSVSNTGGVIKVNNQTAGTRIFQVHYTQLY